MRRSLNLWPMMNHEEVLAALSIELDALDKISPQTMDQDRVKAALDRISIGLELLKAKEASQQRVIEIQWIEMRVTAQLKSVE